ncbi:MAG: hydantoinase B/oxoprolinase family protein [Candidatus Tectomicrobia bacterium]|nr:hydantoinase B/oxoprolinase family protein [Candidatus Tectomicrobia bacterium]
MTKPDPIQLALIVSTLQTVTREMAESMLRTSRSPIFSEVRDFITAIFDRQGRLVAQTAFIPVLMGSTPFAMDAIAARFREEIRDGDVYLLNDPFHGNNHLPDFTVAKPVMVAGDVAFWVMTRGHHADVGAKGSSGYNPEASNVWEEGIRIPPVKLYEGGVRRSDLWEFLLLNIRLADIVEGDLQCQIGACVVGERRLQGLAAKFGMALVGTAIETYLKGTEEQMRREIRRIPNGVYKAERFLDHDGIVKDRLVGVRLTLTVNEDAITFDYSESDPQVKGYVNSPLSNTTSCTYIALFSSLQDEVPVTAGSTAPVSVISRDGTVTNPRPPAATSGCTLVTCAALVEAGWLALAQAVPSQVQAPWGRWCGPMKTAYNPRTGRWTASLSNQCKPGSGATEGYDGWGHIGPISSSGGARAADPELFEFVYPYTQLLYEYRPDSGGAGKWRGGLGTRAIWRMETDQVLCATAGGGLRPETTPPGLAGGRGGVLSHLSLRRPDGTEREIDVNALYELRSGDVLEVASSGGGGFGDPFERAIELVADDVANGYVTPAAARELYGVVIDPLTLNVDLPATEALRKWTRRA